MSVTTSPESRLGTVSQIDAGLLNVGYVDAGPAGGPAAVLLHGWPYDIHSYLDVVPLLTAAGRDVYQPSTDGLSLNTYTGADAGNIDINGELAKLAFNVSFGHGIHAGIHFRSSTHWSILLGEQVALSILRDRARGYNEPFSISIRKFDGTIATISNH